MGAGAAQASITSAEPEDQEPESEVPEFHIDPHAKKAMHRHETLRAQLAMSSQAEDAMERTMRAEEREEREAQETANALQEDLSNHSAPTTPPTEGEEGHLADALPGQVANQQDRLRNTGLGQVEEYQSDEEEFAAPQ